MLTFSRKIAPLAAALLLAASTIVLAEAQGTAKSPKDATLILDPVGGVCTPTKPDVTITRAVHSGLKWDVDNRCDVDVDVEVFGFVAAQTGECIAPPGTKPFKQDSRKEKGVKRNTKKVFANDFTLGKDDGCWTYKVKVNGKTFDPQIRIDR